MIPKNIACASMGPSAFTDGNEGESRAVEREANASMGPSAFTDGNGRSIAWKNRRARLQWGRRRSPTEMRRSPRPRRRSPRRFNGAVGVHRRKSIIAAALTAGSVASMGPSAFTDGNSSSAHRPSSQSQLQWGRRRSPTEIRGVFRDHCGLLASFNGAVGVHRRKFRRPDTLRALTIASMGPSAFTDGNVATAVNTPSSRELQWGRRRSPTEIPRRGASTSWSRRFNGAVGVHRRKWEAATPPVRPGALLQWGRRRSPTEIRRDRDCRRRYRSFNGAVGVHRRK